MALEPRWVKLLGALASLTITLLASWLCQIRWIREREDVLSIINTAGGGVLLAIAVMHLLPDVAEAQEKSGFEYPICYFFVLLGYMLLLLLEKVLFSHHHHHHGSSSDRVSMDETSRLDPKKHSDPHHHHHHDDYSSDLVEYGDDEGADIATPLLLLASMTVHSFFEGLVFGVQTDYPVTVTLCVAILIHKPAEALTLGGLMIKEGFSDFQYLIFAVALAIGTPIGICVGFSLDGADIPPLVMGSFISLTVGSFLYISTTEIIADEFHGNRSPSSVAKWKIYASFIGGASFILLLELLMGGGHEH